MCCPKCDGTGSVLNPQLVGAQMRSEREATGTTVTAVAAAMNFTKAYVSELELGRRGWTQEQVEAYRAALATAKQQRGK